MEFVFAVTTLSRLMEFEKKLQSSGDFKQMITFISGCGGGDFKETVNRILRKIMLDPVAIQFSLKGMRGKLSFSGELPQILLSVLEVLKKNKDLREKINDKTFEDAVSNCLKMASDRESQRKRIICEKQNWVPVMRIFNPYHNFSLPVCIDLPLVGSLYNLLNYWL